MRINVGLEVRGSQTDPDLMALNVEGLFLQVKVTMWEASRNIAIVARFPAVESAHGRTVRSELVDRSYFFGGGRGKTSLCAIAQILQPLRKPHSSHSMTACLWKHLHSN